MSNFKKEQSKSVGAMDAPVSLNVNRLSLDVGAVVDSGSLENHWDSLESGIGSLSKISHLNQDSAGEAAFHPTGPSLEPQADSSNSSMAASMGHSNDFGASNNPREADTSTWCGRTETRESLDHSPIQQRGSDRAMSNVSELSLAGTEGSWSVRSSIDSAICMDNLVTRTPRASLATNRPSVYSVISDIIHEMPESPSDIEEGNPHDVNADGQVSNLPFTVISSLQAREEAHVEYNTTTDKPKKSRIVKLIRFLLRIASTCIRTPEVRSESEPLSFDYGPAAGNHKLRSVIHGHENFAFTENLGAEAKQETQLADNTGILKATINGERTHTGNINSHPATLFREGVDCSSEALTHANERKTNVQKPTFHEFTLEKNDFLKSFKWMLEQAKALGIDVVGQNFQIANFAAAILDCHGGCLSIDDLDVHMYVPPGAIPIEKQQLVYIFVTATSSVNQHHFSTPFVHCGPPDTTFEEDVVLTMPHCVKDTSSCKFSLSKLSPGGSSELSEGLDVITVVDNDSITFSVNHFCGFGATASPSDGTILKKSMIACVFIHADSHPDDEIALRLRLVDDVNVNLREVKTEERENGFNFADKESPLIVLKNDQDVVTKISNCIESWEISEPESCQQKIHRELLWRETAASCAQAFPSVMFFAKRCSGSEKVPFKARMTVYQEGSESCDYGVHFLVKAKEQRDCPPRKLDQEQQLELSQQLLWVQLQSKVDDKRVTGSRLLEQPTFGKLCDLLDAPNPLGNNWCKLQNLLLNTGSGCSENVDSIREKAGRERRSPTKIVLNLFSGKQSGIKKKEETMNALKCALIGMNRPDVKFAVDAIEEQLIKWSETSQGCSTFTAHIPTINVTTDENANLDTDLKVTKNTRKDSAYNSGVVKADEEALTEKFRKDQYSNNLGLNKKH